jgi:Cytochrome c554 and c-prime
MWNIREEHRRWMAVGGLVCFIGLGWLTPISAQKKSSDLPRNHRSHTDSNPISLSTPDRLEDAVWWPTKGTAPRNEYVGTEECAKCHHAKATSQTLTEMAHASTRSIDPALDGQPRLNFREGSYDYDILRRGDSAVESVADGRASISRRLLFAFGEGLVGHTYIYESEGNLYESHVSYYSAIKGLDLTTGHLQSQFADLAAALGRQLELREAQKCFGCHTTASTTVNHFDPSQALAGVTCEACHGPGSRHVLAMMAGQVARGKKSIFNPGDLDSASSVDFCGACHRTSGDVVGMNVGGVATVRFQPFRLEQSRCWKSANEQLTCVTCHDPHEPLAQNSAHYDHICLRCHSPNAGDGQRIGRGQLMCKVSKVECVTCHMPRVEIPGMHHTFVDHWIRIARSNEPYPN